MPRHGNDAGIFAGPNKTVRHPNRETLPIIATTPAARVIGNQLLRSGTSVAANYRATCRARSRAEFVARLAVALEEADETVFWLEMLGDTDVIPSSRLQDLIREGNEVLKIFSAARRTTTASQAAAK